MKHLLIVVATNLAFAGFVLGQDLPTEIPKDDDPIWDKPFGEVSENEKNDNGEIYGNVINNWLKDKVNLRLATAEDYERTDEAFDEAFNVFSSSYEIGDFNGDGKDDLAVILVSKGRKKSFSFAIFNAPFDQTQKKSPSFYLENIGANYVIYNLDDEISLSSTSSDVAIKIKPVGGSYKADRYKTQSDW